MLVTTKEMFEKAQKGNYAIPAANFFDFNSARTYVETAEKLNKPLILAFAQAHMEEISLEEAALVGKYLAEKATVPVALHLDHGQDENIIKQAIDLGFSSVMIDASQDPIVKNIKRSKDIAEYAHQHGVVVEAEIGHVGTGNSYEFKETTDTIYTEVEETARFAVETGVDSLAVSIGTAHGEYKGIPKISFERLKEISNVVAIPLVLHGGSSSGDENLSKCAQGGISKINIFTDFIVAGMKSIEKHAPTDLFSLRKYVNEAMAETLTHYYEVFGTK
ncbi:ketose-bisphosphate aldolase [Enterococcus sp. PF1-24]|uniref:class II fructose-bisphosphate aldolase n=1 Tax=unclassified Enterococcus TaxID=2608891 RepID=UPI0024763047|nr:MULTISPECIES: class II fructose-bisphosphate aldolase [unclassified Enterococcus]MDH6364241.1 ketose-bisphosphate aldolase [Enterococcus sp. PFB1-1]MDH6401400.1 ketose-bisphosphate aldolase [Enterococcus sp. PF1-24]